MNGEYVPAIGIDIGTSFCRIGAFKNGEFKVIADKQGRKYIPTCVTFTDTQILVGHEAVDLFAVNPANTVYGVKCLLGRTTSDVQLRQSFTITHTNDKTEIEVDYRGETRTFFPEEIIAMIMLKLKDIAEDHLGTAISGAVISVPSGFDSFQRQAIKDAASIAGLRVLRMMNESSAAALAYGYNKSLTEPTNVLIVSLGSGSLDVSVVSIEDDVFSVESYASNLRLGGINFDNRMVNCLVRDFRQKHRKDPTHDKFAMQRLRNACVTAKEHLSSSSWTKIKIESFYDGKDFEESFSAMDLENLCADLFQSILEPVKKALRDAQLDKTQIGRIVLTGGSTKVPKIRNLLQMFFNGKDLEFLDDDAVVVGTAIQAAVLGGHKSEGLQNLLILEALHTSLGVETPGGVMTTITKRNSTLPTKATQIISISDANQVGDKLAIKIYEGERTMVKDNMLLGSLVLGRTIKSTAEDKKNEIEVTFDMDANGDLMVLAVDQSSKEERRIEIVSRARLDSDRIKSASREFKWLSMQGAKQDLADHCAKVKSAVEGVLDKCSEIDRALDEISYPLECKRKRDELDGMVRKLLDQTSA